MDIKYYDKEKGTIAEIHSKGIKVPFYENLGPAFYYKDKRTQVPIELTGKDGIFTGEVCGVQFTLEHIVTDDVLRLKATVKNTSDVDFIPDAIGLKLGIDSYMTNYPQWNDRFFPSFMRCEKTHFTGYLMSPLEKVVAVVCNTPVAAWELDYNIWGDEDEMNCHFGHRIYTGCLLLTVNDKLPQRHPEGLTGIKAGEEKQWVVDITLLDGVKNFKNTVADKFNLPMIEFEKYALYKGEEARLSVFCNEEYTVRIESPTGNVTNGITFTADEYGVYTATVTTASGKVSEGKVYCRHNYGWYLKAARKNAVYKPQKATTHTESWYGHFSSFLAQKHYPDTVLDNLAKANFDEIMPYMYEFETGRAIVDPHRVQNMSALVSMLVDLYEAEGNPIYLDYASNFADEIIKHQDESGAYKNGNTHYTSVIYVAKSLLELALVEKDIYKSRYDRHYASVTAAVNDLKDLGERIGTEGEHTLEDGMISCSALQLGYYALTLPEEERVPYVAMAEHLMSVHKCLEELETPDCRMRGATLRFWEAQYDVMMRGNMMNTPHGWTSWKNYATYYLYLLTGKEEYLKDTVDTMGACLQMVDEEENLRWAFIKDPYIRVKAIVPDVTKPVNDGYASVPEDIKQAYRGKYELKTFGEEYIDMISDWYRTGEQKLTGGYELMTLWYGDYGEDVDNQGGACDNDVHEHFKCLEETLLKKAFVVVKNGVRGYNCSAVENDGCVTVTLFEECDYIHVNTDRPVVIDVDGKKFTLDKGMQMLDL